MEAFEALSLCAEIAIAITGFSGVLLVFGDQRGGRKTQLDRVLFRTLFTATLVPLSLVAIAFVLDSATVAGTKIWQTCSIAYMLAQSITAFYDIPGAARTRAEQTDSPTLRPTFISRAGVGLVAVAVLVFGLQLANAVSLHASSHTLTGSRSAATWFAQRKNSSSTTILSGSLDVDSAFIRGGSVTLAFSYDVDTPYSPEAWRGRIRASAGVGASMTSEQVENFDAELAEMLAARFPGPTLHVPHRVFAVVARAPERAPAA